MLIIMGLDAKWLFLIYYEKEPTLECTFYVFKIQNMNCKLVEKDFEKVLVNIEFG